jgi:hypothetical protein
MSILVSLLVQNRIFLEIFRSKSYAARRRTKQKQIYNKELKYKKIQKKKGQSTFLFLSHISNIQSTKFGKQNNKLYIANINSILCKVIPFAFNCVYFQIKFDFIEIGC